MTARAKLAVAAGAGLAAVLFASAAAAATTGWQLMTSPNMGTNHNQLNAVSAASAHSAWAVGIAYNGSSDRALIERYNGRTWTLAAAANAGSHHNELDAVAALSPTNAWAVGRYLPAVGQERTLTEHWNGSKWSVVASPNQGTSHNEFDAVATGGGGVVWAAGHYDPTATRNDRALLERYAGGAWHLVTAPDKKTGTTVDDSSIVGLANVPRTSQMWAVGSYINGTVIQTLVEHYTGTKWVVVPSPNPSAKLHSELSSVVALSPRDVWAVGFSYTGTRDVTLVEHWNGTAWKIVTSPNVGTHHNELRSVTAQGASNVTAVGYYYGTTDHALAEHWNGRAWAVTPTANVGSHHNELDGVTTVPGTSTRIAVGLLYSGTVDRTLVERSG